MRDAVHFIFERHCFKIAERRRQPRTGHPPHKGLALHAVFNERLDRHHLQLVHLGKLRQLRHARHGAVLVHDFADHAGGIQSGQPRQIDRTLRLPGAPQHTALLRLQGENMTGLRQVAGLRLRIDCHMNGRGPIRGRNAGRNVFSRIDGHGEGRAERGGILRRLLRQLELLHPLRGQGETDQSTGMFGHEIDGLRRHMFGGNDKIAFVLTILIIDEDDAFPLFDVFDCVFDTMKGRGHGFLQFRGVIARY